MRRGQRRCEDSRLGDGHRAARGSRSPLGRTSLRDQRGGGKRCRPRCQLNQGRRAVWNRLSWLSVHAGRTERSGPPTWMVTRSIRGARSLPLLHCVPHCRIAGRAGYRSWLRVAPVVVAVAHRRLGPSSSATTSTVDRALPSSAVQARCWSRPTTTTRLLFDRDSAACSGWSRQTTRVKNDASSSRRPETATRKMAWAMPLSVCRSSGSSVRLPAKHPRPARDGPDPAARGHITGYVCVAARSRRDSRQPATLTSQRWTR
jgi:hypothetical protein